MHRLPTRRAASPTRALGLAVWLAVFHSLLTAPILAQSADSVSLAPGVRAGAAGSSRAVIDSLDVQRSAASTLSELLQARAASVGVLMSGGTLTDGGRILIRGPSTINTAGVPLLIVDGMRMAEQEDDSSSTASRLDDIALDDIATVEILRGPAAASLFGAGASSGVIVVTTKRGARAGWHVGARTFADARQASASLPVNYHGLGYYGSNTTTISVCPLVNLADGQCTRTSLVTSDPLGALSSLRTGAGGRASVDVSGGSSTGAVRLSLTGRQATGIASDDRLSQLFTRLNATQRLGRGLDVAGHVSWLGGTSRRSELGRVIVSGLDEFAGTTTPSFADDAQSAFAHPTDQHHAHLTLGGDVAWHPLPWLVVRGALTRDRNDARSAQSLDSSTVWFGVTSPFAYRSVWGSSAIGTSRATAEILHTVPGLPRAQGRVIVGTERVVRARNGADTLNYTPDGSVSRLTWYNASGVNNAEFLSERIAIGERLTLGAGVRRERDTRADTAFRFYPNADAAWTAPSSIRGGVLRVRAAYGEAAQPFELFNLQPLPRVGSSFTSAVDLPLDLPERVRELEGGIDLDWGGRGAISATIYRRTEKVVSIVPSALVFFGVVSRDASTRGVELDARRVVLERSSWRWELRAIASALRNRVGAGVPYISNAGGVMQEGAPIYGVSSATPSYSDTNGDGLISYAESRPSDAFSDLRASTPTFEGALHSTLAFRSHFTLFTIVDRRSGHYGIPGSEVIHCARQNCRDGQDPSATLADQARALYLQTGRGSSSAAFTRLREVALRWVLAPSGSDTRRYGGATLVVAGRDLATWSGFRGLDPEINTNPRGALVQNDAGGVPLPRRVSIGLELGAGAH